ncbi:MAG TPA: CHASE3 domain-containing protein [Verrucomicrobiae bacterium]|jgi:PAS domain S-box-containing protein|nr:CHASE3 domain-containing protein [Verrucomicrobiae bacterium]
MKDNIETRVIVLFLLMVGILIYVAISSVNNIKRSVATSDWVNHTHDVILQADAVVSSLHAGDSALRTYLMTGDRRDQGQYRSFYNEMVEHMEQAKALTRSGDETSLNGEFLHLEGLIKERIDFTRTIVTAREQKGLEGARAEMAAHPDIEQMGKLQRLVNSIISQEKGFLRERDQEARAQAEATKWIVHLGLIVNFMLLVFVSWLLRDDLASRRKAAQALEDANAQLEIKVQQRTAELVASNTNLKKENLEKKWSNQALDHQLRYSQLIINSIDELIFVISKALNVSRINPAVLRVSGWEPTEIIAQSLDRVIQLPDGDSAGAMTVAMREGREIQNRSANLVCKGGTTVPIRFSLIPLHDQDKVVGGVVTVRLAQPPPSA